MAYLDRFHLVVGETIMECQRVEWDIKVIYAAMLKGDIERNFDGVKTKTLGEALRDLRELDNCDGSPYFSRNDYKRLEAVSRARNWIAHNAYSDFMYYKSDEEWESALEKCFSKVVEFRDEIKALGESVEKIRFDVLKRYGRIDRSL